MQCAPCCHHPHSPAPASRPALPPPPGRGNNLTKMGASSRPRDVAMQVPTAPTHHPPHPPLPLPSPRPSPPHSPQPPPAAATLVPHLSRPHPLQVAAQARACVDCPTLQVVGPQSCNQALKAVAIARTFLKESASTDICIQPSFMLRAAGATAHRPALLPWPPEAPPPTAPPPTAAYISAGVSASRPTFMQLEDGHTGILIYIRKKFRRTTGEAEAQQLKAASGTDAKVSSQYSHISARQVRPPAAPTPRRPPGLLAYC
jgi:stage V sporulation protein SpoVS